MARQRAKQTESPIGVEIRGNSIRIIFYFQGVMCRETIVTGISKANINYASRRRSEILRKIEDNEFNYRLEFPNSNNPAKFEAYYPTCEYLFLKLIERYERSNKKPITKITYRRIIMGKLLPFFREILVRDVTATLIKEYISTLSHTAKYINQITLQLKAMLDYALNDGLIKSHPFSELTLDKLIADVSTESTYEVMPLTEQEQDKLFQCCDDLLIRWFIVLACNTGMRLGELIALRWENVHTNYIEVKHNIVKGNLSSPKTKSGHRKILLLPKAKEALIQLRLITGHHDNVIVSSETNQPWSGSDSFWKHWGDLIHKADIPYRQPYQMRHTYASMLLSRGENPLWVATQMGHVDTEMITRVYARWIPQENESLGYKLKGSY